MTFARRVAQVRDLLRGLPDTLVSIEFLRDGGGPPREVTLRRQLVRLQDVRLATLLEAPYDRVGKCPAHLACATRVDSLL